MTTERQFEDYQLLMANLAKLPTGFSAQENSSLRMTFIMFLNMEIASLDHDDHALKIISEQQELTAFLKKLRKESLN